MCSKMKLPVTRRPRACRSAVTVVGSSGEFAAAYHFAGEFFEGDVDAQKHLTDQKIRRGTHTSVQALEVDIRD